MIYCHIKASRLIFKIFLRLVHFYCLYFFGVISFICLVKAFIKNLERGLIIMDVKRIEKAVLCIILSVAMVAGAVDMPALAEASGIDSTEKNNTKSSSTKEDSISGGKAGTGIRREPAATAEPLTGGAFDKQDIVKLMEEKKFTVSDPSVNMDVHKKGNGVLIKGNCDAVTGSAFTFTQDFDFGSEEAEYIIVDGLAERKKNTFLQFYLDGEKEPFASVKLNCQKRKDYWNISKNSCGNIKDRNISGKHKVSFKVVTDDEKNVVFLMRSIFFMKSDIPMVSLDIDESQGTIGEMNGDTSHNTECYGTMSVDIPAGYQSEYSDKVYKPGTYKLDYIRGRGNSTWYADKRPYKIKLEKSTDFFGMGKNKHWILLANHYDVSLLRNKITYWLGTELGMKFTPQCVFVNVVMNNQYLGSYYLCEQIRVGKSRVDIDDLEADEASKNATTGSAITGGYLLGMSPYTSNDEQSQQFATKMGNQYVIQSPGFEDYFNEAQYNYIAGYVQSTEDAIYGDDFKDSKGVRYSEYMDVNSAVDYYWVQEISSNGDAYGSSSTNLYKERNGKLFWGPLWDFDYVAWGNLDKNTEGFNKTTATWFERLMQDKEFTDKLISRWSFIKGKLAEAYKDGGQLDKYAAQLYNSQKANYNVNNIFDGDWSEGIIGATGGALQDEVVYVDVDGNIEAWNPGVDTGVSPDDITFEGEVQRLKEWIAGRVEWIDGNLDSLVPDIYEITYMSEGEVYKKDKYNSNSYRGLELPEEPVKKGYKFKGWYIKTTTDGKKSENYISQGYRPSGDTVLYAKWIKNSKIVKAKKITFAQEEFYYPVYSSVYLDWDGFAIYTIPFDAEIDKTGLEYETSDKKIADINFETYIGGDGKIEKTRVLMFSSPGDVTVTATTKDGLKASCLVHVIGTDGDPGGSIKTDFKLNKEEMSLKKGKYGHIIPKLLNTGVYVNYTYASSDEDIAEVNGAGYVYAKKKGTVYIAVMCTSSDLMKLCKVTVKGKEDTTGNKKPGIQDLKKGTKFKSGGLQYKITSTVTGREEVQCTGFAGKSLENAKIPGTVQYKNTEFKVTAIGKSAFEGCKQLKKAVLGSNITAIGEKAFYNCKLLKLLEIQSEKLKKTGRQAVGKVAKNFSIKAPSGRQDKYAKMLNIK